MQNNKQKDDNISSNLDIQENKDVHVNNTGSIVNDNLASNLSPNIVENEESIETNKVVPLIEPDKDPTIVVPVVSTEPVTEVPTNLLDTSIEEKKDVNNKAVVDKKNNLKFYIILGILIVLICVVSLFIFSMLFSTNRKGTLNDIDKEDVLKFTIDDKEFYIGESVASLKKKGLTYNEELLNETDYIVSDSIAVYPFYYNDEAILLGALYCPTEENCKYDDAILIKANFYDEVDFVVDDNIEIGSTYKEVKKEYGKKDGKFYQDNDFYVWALGDEGKIGEPYYLLKFNDNDRVEEIRIGVWWYEEEYEYTIK